MFVLGPDSNDPESVKISPDAPSTIAFNRPPVVPTGAKNIEISTQLFVSYVDPVQRHFPFIHAPFLLQWYGQVFLELQ